LGFFSLFVFLAGYSNGFLGFSSNNARFVFIVACLLYYVLKKYFLPASIILKVITFILIYIFSFAVWCIILSVSATGQ